MKKTKKLTAALLALLLMFCATTSALAAETPPRKPTLADAALVADGISVSAEINNADKTARAQVAGAAHKLLLTAGGAETVELALTEGVYAPYAEEGAAVTLIEGDNVFWVRLTGGGQTIEYTLTVHREADGIDSAIAGGGHAQPQQAAQAADDPNDTSIQNIYLSNYSSDNAFLTTEMQSDDGVNYIFSRKVTLMTPTVRGIFNNPVSAVTLKDASGADVPIEVTFNRSGFDIHYLPLTVGNNQFTLEVIPQSGDVSRQKTYNLMFYSGIDNLNDTSIDIDAFGNYSMSLKTWDSSFSNMHTVFMESADGFNFSAETGPLSEFYVQFSNPVTATLKDAAGNEIDAQKYVFYNSSLYIGFNTDFLPLMPGSNQFTLEVTPRSGNASFMKTYNLTINVADFDTNDASIVPDAEGNPALTLDSSGLGGSRTTRMRSDDGVNFHGSAAYGDTRLSLSFTNPLCTATLKDTDGREVGVSVAGVLFNTDALPIVAGSNQFTLEVLPPSGDAAYKKTYNLTINSIFDFMNDASIAPDQGLRAQPVSGGGSRPMWSGDGVNYSGGTVIDAEASLELDTNSPFCTVILKDAAGQVVYEESGEYSYSWSPPPLSAGSNKFTLEVTPRSGNPVHKKTYNVDLSCEVPDPNDITLTQIYINNGDSMEWSADRLRFTGTTSSPSDTRIWVSFHDLYSTSTLKDAAGQEIVSSANSYYFSSSDIPITTGSNQFTLEVTPQSGDATYRKTYHLTINYEAPAPNDFFIPKHAVGYMIHVFAFYSDTYLTSADGNNFSGTLYTQPQPISLSILFNNAISAAVLRDAAGQEIPISDFFPSRGISVSDVPAPLESNQFTLEVTPHSLGAAYTKTYNITVNFDPYDASIATDADGDYELYGAKNLCA